MQFNYAQGVVLTIAFMCLLSGLTLYFQIANKRNAKNFQTINLIIWLLLALFPTLVLFAIFPGNEAKGTVLGISVSGSLAAFLVIWLYGSKLSINARRIDSLEAQVKELSQTIDLERQKVGKGPTPITRTKEIRYRFREIRGKSICLITGKMQDVKVADVWVNSENTNMQMARFFDRSISSVIRYLGAVKDEAGNVLEDTIANELDKAVGGASIVAPASVFVTSAGELQETNNVKRLVHVAAVQGEFSHGYFPIQGIENCVTKVLHRVDSAALKELNIKSILFPLIGTGTGRGNSEEIIGKLLDAAVSYLETNPNSTLEKIFFLTYTDADLIICTNILDKIDELELVES